MTLTLDFQGQILKMLYLRNGRADWHGTKEMWADRMLDSHCDLWLWPHPWPWPWIFKVNFWNSCISGTGGPIRVGVKSEYAIPIPIPAKLKFTIPIPWLTVPIPIPDLQFQFQFRFFFFFLPEASFGLRVLLLPASVCVCVHVCVNPQLVHAMTHHPFKLGSPNLDQRCKRPWLRSLLFCGMIDRDLQGQIELQRKKFTPFWACPCHNSPP